MRALDVVIIEEIVLRDSTTYFIAGPSGAAMLVTPRVPRKPGKGRKIPQT
jgi:hypothetical protein